MKKVAILGFGVEGRAAWRYFTNQGADITILDEKERNDIPEGVQLKVGPEIFAQAYGFDQVVRTPSIRPDRIRTDGEVTSVTKEFFKVCPAPIIGVTGTKGKSTTATLIRDMLQAAGKKAYLVGNIGLPALEIMPEVTKSDIVVYELSSFQLWDLTQSPHVAVVLTMEPEHLNAHNNLDEYIEAKAAISTYQDSGDVTIYLPHNSLTEQIALRGEGQKIPYTMPPGAYVEEGDIKIGGQKVIAAKDTTLVGPHNLDNACAAITAVWQFTQNYQAIATALHTFKGLDHRLKFVAEVNGVQYIDDSIATTPGSAIAALKSFKNPKIIILGGVDKGADFTELAHEVAQQHVKKTLLLGEKRFTLQAALQKAGFQAFELFDDQTTMQAVVERAHELANSGDIVILSPACASYDMFKSYVDRGNQFIEAALALKK